MIAPGLCAACRHGRPIRSDRGSQFWLCRRSASDPTFARYPALPVLACRGFERRPDDGHDGNTRPPQDGADEPADAAD